ncbi:hypothetical protein BASA81_018084 [Batrachochytrium salamandrivorans]|nr:hypothetical protein BASA81_018084 [Batrachochytrium salamandrivorans]
MLVSSLIALLAISATSVSASNYAKYNLLKDDRDAGRLVFPPTTLDQREAILSNAWANYDSKKANYGSAADPFPIVKKLRENIKTVTDEEFHLGLTDAFVKIRDKHTHWINMAPYSCFYTTTGVEFAFIEGDADIANKPTVVVTYTSTSYDLRSLFGKDYYKIRAGDELLAVNGLSFVEWFKQNQFTSGAGANAFGGQRSALDYLSMIYGESNRLPSEDFITFEFKSQANPQNSYTVNVPYVSGHDDDCWNLGSNLYKSLTGTTLPGTPPMSLPGHNYGFNTARLSPRSYKMDSIEHLERKVVVEQIFNSERKSTVSLNPTDVTQIRWGIYNPRSTNMGVIRLDDFSPEEIGNSNSATLKAVMIIRSLLANELKNTNSVIYELRGNPGGSVSFANSMVQLFKPDFRPFGDQYLMNNVTYNIFVKGKDPNSDPHAKAWQETKPGSRYSNVFFSNSAKFANTMGQAYLRPMGILNDAKCYSSCEIFSGSIQSHGVGTIFGEDGQTGGGGASVMELDPLLIDASPTDFHKFPFSQQLTSGSKTYTNALTVGVTKTIRVGRYSDRDIEDLGEWSEQAAFVSEPFTIENSLGKFSLEVESAGIEEFTVVQADGNTVSAQQKTTTNKQRLSLPVSATATTLGNSQITILGKTAGTQVLKTNRNIRTIPTDDKYMKISTPGLLLQALLMPLDSTNPQLPRLGMAGTT